MSAHVLSIDATVTPMPVETLAQSPADDARAAEQSMGGGPIRVSGYEILKELGRGGMGIVYQARQIHLNRITALKVVLGDVADSRSLIRFLAEAEAVAAVKHPNVVEVYEFGESAGRQYLALEFLSGGTLDDRVGGPDCKKMKPTEAATILSRVARGVAAAHDQGIVHRDLKPANVLFDAAGEPKVTDFGLAKRTAGHDLTRTQAVMGTPAYMAPEQARGNTKFVGPQADVYALGVILYEALTGRRPFEADDTLSLLCKVAEDDPVPPRQSVAGLSPDIERICLKCLEKDPAERYPTATALADDLARFAAGETVSVRAPGPLERVTRWAKRKPTVAAAYALSGLAAVLVGVTVGMVVLWQKAVDEREHAVDALDLAERLKAKEAGSRAEADRQRKLAVAARESEAKALEHISRINYAYTIRLAQTDVEDDNLAGARNLLDQCPAEYRNWEWHFLNRLLKNPLPKPSTVGAALPSKDLPGPEWVRAAMKKQLDARKAVTQTDDAIQVFDPATGKKLAVLKGKIEKVVSATLSPDGSQVVTVGGLAAHVWNTEEGKELVALHGHTHEVFSACYSPDGARILTISNRTVRVWDPVTGKELITLRGGPAGIKEATFSPDGNQIVTVDPDGSVQVYDGSR